MSLYTNRKMHQLKLAYVQIYPTMGQLKSSWTLEQYFPKRFAPLLFLTHVLLILLPIPMKSELNSFTWFLKYIIRILWHLPCTLRVFFHLWAYHTCSHYNLAYTFGIEFGFEILLSINYMKRTKVSMRIPIGVYLLSVCARLRTYWQSVVLN